ncbi:MAG: flagellar protein FlgN [Candidatus Kapaibacteriota bacterium]|jgi:flagellar biosynthesis/type III secretory pathway chaperone
MEKLTEIIEKEYQLLKEMVRLAEEQKNALVHYDINSVERITMKLNEVAKELKNYENERINVLVNDVKLTRRQALTVKMTELTELLNISEETDRKREEMLLLIEKLASLNSLNKLLTNRALSSINEILSTLSNSNNSVCNVRV